MICVIPARSGSKRLEGKNFKDFLGFPLFLRTVKQAESLRIPTIVVGDSDWDKYNIDLVHRTKAVYMNRPDNLADDSASTWSVVKWAVKTRTDVLLLQVTSPLRSLDDIRGAIDLFESSGKAVTSTHIGVPNGAIYIRPFDQLETDDWLPYNMPSSRSVDIDTAEDFRKAEAVAKQFKEIKHDSPGH